MCSTAPAAGEARTKDFGHLDGCERSAEQETLKALAPEPLQHRELLVGFDSFSDHFDVESASHRYDRSDDCGTTRLVSQIADEGSIDLDAIDRERVKIRE